MFYLLCELINGFHRGINQMPCRSITRIAERQKTQKMAVFSGFQAFLKWPSATLQCQECIAPAVAPLQAL
jgi:hypothetical protein